MVEEAPSADTAFAAVVVAVEPFDETVEVVAVDPTLAVVVDPTIAHTAQSGQKWDVEEAWC